MNNGFDTAIKFLIEHETVYKKGHYGDLNYAISENEEGDSGGLTKFGIDQRSHPDVDIENLDYEQAVEIYKTEYWDKCNAESLPFPLSLVQVDGAVNTGVHQQNKFLQRVCNTTDDGIFGPNTLKAVLNVCSAVGPQEVALRVIDLRDKFYRKLAADHPEKGRFLNGWLNRLEDLKKKVIFD